VASGFELNWASPPTQPKGWYRKYDPCKSYDGAMYHCDEYPFRSTTQAGPGASLALISPTDNTNEGSYLFEVL
jgi:hypothetical protein